MSCPRSLVSCPRLLLVCPLLLLAAGQALATSGMIPVSQRREITVTTYPGPNTLAAADFERFNQTLSGSWQSDSGSALQDSSLGRFSVTGHLWAEFNGQSWGGSSSSKLEYTFQVDEQVQYLMQGTLRGHDGAYLWGNGSASAKLTGPGGTILFSHHNEQSTPLDVSEGGVLDPGVYTLYWGGGVGISGYDPGYGDADLNGTFTVTPEPTALAFLLLGGVGLCRRQQLG